MDTIRSSDPEPQISSRVFGEKAPRPLTLFDPQSPPILAPLTPRASLALSFDELVAQAPRSHILLGNLADDLSMITLRRFLHRASRLLEPSGSLSFFTRPPESGAQGDLGNLWPGEHRGDSRYRPLRHYVELLRLFPVSSPALREWKIDGTTVSRWTVTRIPAKDPVTSSPQPLDEKYGPESTYRRFQRLEEPEILDDLLWAVSRMKPVDGERVLSVGTNDGTEFSLFSEATEAKLEFWGIDGAPRAIEGARRRFAGPQYTFLNEDLNRLDRLSLPQFHLVLLLNLLQCRTVDRDLLLENLKPLLASNARLLISLPNCHFAPSDILRRPYDRRALSHDRGPMLKTLRFLARHFYRTGFRSVETFGTYDIFLLVR